MGHELHEHSFHITMTLEHWQIAGGIIATLLVAGIGVLIMRAFGRFLARNYPVRFK